MVYYFYACMWLCPYSWRAPLLTTWGNWNEEMRNKLPACLCLEVRKDLITELVHELIKTQIYLRTEQEISEI